MNAINRNDQTVLDVAITADNSSKTVMWLLDMGAKGTRNYEDILEAQAEEQRNEDLLMREVEAMARQAEDQARRSLTRMLGDCRFCCSTMANSRPPRKAYWFDDLQLRSCYGISWYIAVSTSNSRRFLVACL